MRTLHILDHIGLGGAQKIVSMILENDSESGLYVLRKTDYKNIYFKKTSTHNSKSKFTLSPIKEISELIKKKNIKILHCHLFRSKFIGYLVKKFYHPEVKLIFHEHGEISKNYLYKMLLFLSRKKVSVYLAVSEQTKNQLRKIKFIDQNKILKLENFASLNPTTDKEISEFKKKFKLKLNVFTIGFVGRLHLSKNCRLLIESAALLDFPFQLLIVGDGKEMRSLRELIAKLKLNKKIIFTGAINNTSPTYKCMDVLVSPSTSETFGLTALEAQLAGVPVIVSKVFEGVVSADNALFLEKLETKSLAQLIEKLFSSSDLRKKLIRNGHANAKKFSVKEYFKKINDLYTKTTF